MTAWHPNRAQWIVIWATVLVTTHFWLDLRFSDIVSGEYGSWGLSGYLFPIVHYGRHSTRAALTVLVIGLLLVWQLGGKSKRQAAK